MTKYTDVRVRDVGAVADALANPRRRSVIDRLCSGPATTTELSAVAGASLPTMHQHLDVLRTAGLLHSIKRGRTVTHTLDPEPMASLQDWIATRRSFWSNQLTTLANALEDSDGH